MHFKRELYIKRIGQRELLENILDYIETRRINMEKLVNILRKMLVEIDEELRAYTRENDRFSLGVYSNHFI